MKPSEVMYLELSKFDEISNDGCIQMLVELLYDYGLIDKHETKKEHYEPVNDLDHACLRIYSDCLSREKIRHMHNIIHSVVTHLGKTEFVHTILLALSRCQQGVGGLHTAIHMLVMIYKVYYPAMLQVVQAVLGRKRI